MTNQHIPLFTWRSTSAPLNLGTELSATVAQFWTQSSAARWHQYHLFYCIYTPFLAHRDFISEHIANGFLILLLYPTLLCS